MTYLQQKIMAVLLQVSNITLATEGAAGLQASVLPCQADQGQLWILLPENSDHLLNLETQGQVVLVTPAWTAQAKATMVEPQAVPANLTLRQHPYFEWCKPLVLNITRLQINRADGWGYTETFDLNTDSSTSL